MLFEDRSEFFERQGKAAVELKRPMVRRIEDNAPEFSLDFNGIFDTLEASDRPKIHA